jgi:hypothetical protein
VEKTFLKRDKKIKLGKGVPVGNILKNKYLPPFQGGMFPEDLFANKKFAKSSLRGHPTGRMWS